MVLFGAPAINGLPPFEPSVFADVTGGAGVPAPFTARGLTKIRTTQRTNMPTPAVLPMAIPAIAPLERGGGDEVEVGLEVEV